MHGFGLHFLLNRNHRANAARMAFSRPLLDQKEREEIAADPTDMNTIADKWYHIEGLTGRDQFMIAFFRRYGHIIYAAIDKPRAEKLRN